MEWQKPDYLNCGANIISSISNYCGMPLHIPTHPTLDEKLAGKSYRNIVLMLFDGMGMDILEHTLPEDSFLRRHCLKPLSAVCPATTTNATTVIECGCYPREHGWLGWTLYFPQIEKYVDIFTNMSGDEKAADYNVAERFMPLDPIFPRLNRNTGYEAYYISRFGTTRIGSMDEMFDTALTLSRNSSRHYLYCYWPDPDHTMHEKGCYDESVLETVREIDRRFEAFADAMPEDTLLLATADHGLINARHHYLEDYPELYSMLERFPDIEARAAAFHVKPEYKDRFPEAFRKIFPENAFLLITGQTFIDEYLGGGRIIPNVYDFVGDYVALATDADCIDGHRRNFELVGVHAGLTRSEMCVPFICVEK